MATNIRTRISETNPYFITKHAYLMTKHFAMQYSDWKKQKNEIESRVQYGFRIGGSYGNDISKPVEEAQEKAEKYAFRTNLIEQAAKIAGEEIWEYVLIGVTTECSYEYLRLTKNIPCCKDVYYRMYRKFFWILNNELLHMLDGSR